MSTPMFDIPEHTPIRVNWDGQGPIEVSENGYWTCWCTEEQCIWKTALNLAQRMAWDEGEQAGRGGGPGHGIVPNPHRKAQAPATNYAEPDDTGGGSLL